MTSPGGTGPRTEEHKVSGRQLLQRVKELIHEGNVRKIIIKNDQGKSLLEIPLTMGIAGAVFLPVFAAVGAIAALASNYTIVVERDA
ncbi:MAG: DUF4342 domain-containing protein [Gemmatimonadota bacterium]|nr:DUF4342 domain-containing protein [Gemmatimonadota bacterium]